MSANCPVLRLAGAKKTRSVSALYALHEGAYIAYIPGAPDFVNRPFGELFPDGVPAVTPFVVEREKPAASADDAAADK